MSAASIGIVCRVSADPTYIWTPWLSVRLSHSFYVMFYNDPNQMATLPIGFIFNLYFPSCIEMNCHTTWPLDYKHFSDNLHTTSDFLMWRNLLWRGMPAYFQFCTNVYIKATTHYYVTVEYGCSCQFLDGKELYKGVTAIYPIFLSVNSVYVFTGKEEENELYKPQITASIGHDGLDLYTYSRSWVPEDDIIGPWEPI